MQVWTLPPLDSLRQLDEEQLQVNGCAVSAEALSVIAEMPRLSLLVLSKCTVERLPASVARARHLKTLTLSDTPVPAFEPGAFRAQHDREALQVFLGGESDFPALARELLAHGLGEVRFSFMKMKGFDEKAAKKMLATLEDMGDDCLGQPVLRQRCFEFGPDADGWAVSIGLSTSLPTAATRSDLTVLDLPKKPFRQRALLWLERALPNPLAAGGIPPGARFLLLGTPLYYERKNLVLQIESRGFGVEKALPKATHVLVMDRPGDKISGAIASDLPIVLEMHLKEVFESAAPKRVEPGTDNAENVEQMLLRDDPKGLRLALEFLKSTTVPRDLLPLLVAIMLFSPDPEHRANYKALVLSKTDESTHARFAGDKRAYFALRDGKKVAKLIESMKADLGLDPVLFSRFIMRVLTWTLRASDVAELLWTALQFPENGPHVFGYLAKEPWVPIWFLKGRIPAGLERLTAAEELRFVHCKLTGGLEELAKAPKLRKLELSGKVKDVRPLGALTDLEELDVGGTDITSLFFVAKLGRLKRLSLSNTAITDLSPVASLKDLEYLCLAWTPAADLQPLAGLKRLRNVALNEMANLRDVAPLAHIASLTHVNLINSKVDDIGPLEQLAARLQELKLYGTNVSAESKAKLLSINPQLQL